MRSKQSLGFTLIELLVSLAILSVLGLMTVPVVEVMAQRTKEQDLRRALRDIRDAIDAYKRATEDGSVEWRTGTSGYPPSLDILVSGAPSRADPKGRKVYFLRRLPPDPLGDKRDLEASATWGKRSFDSEATAPREGDDVYDVYSMSDKTGLNGVPYRLW
jgi:general secretion pathway protein G